MAEIHTYLHPTKGPMRRTASSHIPIPVSKLKGEEMSHRNLSAPEPSRLLVMQSRYQEQLNREKEAKLIKMYRENQDAALMRVGASGTKQGIVREFFRERREIEQSNSSPILDRTEHFQQKKIQNKNEQMRREEEKERQLHRIRRASSDKQLSQQSRFSHSKSLAPIRKGQSQSMKNMHLPQGSDGMYNETTNQFKYEKDDEFSGMQFHQKQPLSGQTSNKHSAIPQRTNKTSRTNIKPTSEQYLDYEDENGKPISKNTSPLKQVNKLKTRPQVKAQWLPSVENADSDWGDGTANEVKQGKPQLHPKLGKVNKSKAKHSKPEWKPPATYSDEDEGSQTPSPNFPKLAHIKRKPDPYIQTKKQYGNTQKMSEYQKWQLGQDLERVDRLEKYQRELERKGQTEINYQFDHDLKEQRAKQQQRKKEFDEMEQQMKELEVRITRKQFELTQLSSESEVENSPLQPQSRSSDTRLSQLNTLHHSKQNSVPWKQKEVGSVNKSTPYNDTNSVAPRENIITKPARVHSRGNTKPKSTYQQQLQQKQDLPLVSTPESQEEIPQSTATYYAQIADTSNEAREDLDLQGCPGCGRQFAVDRLAKHAKVCQKAAKKKPRKVFDTRKQRLEGTELAAYASTRQHLSDERPKKKSNWREKHNEFIRAIRDARKVQNHIAKGGDIRDLPPPAPTEHSDYKQCPHCKRRFDPSVAERHIPKCKDIKSRPPPPKKIGRR